MVRQSALKNTVTYRHAHELEIGNLLQDDIGNLFIVVIVVVQALTDGLESSNGLVESQGYRPNGVVSQRGFQVAFRHKALLHTGVLLS